MRLAARLARRVSGTARRGRIVAAALARVGGQSAEGERLLDRELPASSLLSGFHFRETSPDERPTANNGNFSGRAVL
ncbi:hypothetical protein [Aureimonas leprariae]|uniref:Uncharacterized protein n=1 Tax=Plantimonas leprariae TaxID=2615207 RepID=A0A7V7TWR3_9HYPH|nr:hypothetical protein [Aureimonas leprariae]KAB0679949.1 hypothetical protein F6X38_10265 [Aureimonas leprariae]